MLKRLGGQTVRFQSPPSIIGYASVAGKKEGEGPLRDTFDLISYDSYFGEKTWEKAESAMLKQCFGLCCDKARVTPSELDYIFSGDLLNQCMGSAVAMKDCPAPYFGLYGACSTMAEGLSLAAMTLDGGFADTACALTSSHFCSSERQYRFPLEYGGVRAPTAQWTVTAAGCCLLQPAGPGVPIAAATFGRVQDYQVRDINNMGAAMAPAAASTLLHYFADTHTEPQEFDCIYTGDLVQVGSSLLRELLAAEGLLVKNHVDCGCILFDAAEQQVKSGGSGPGCCAAVLCGHILPRLLRRSQKRVLFVATGALMSQTTFLQKESIPAVAHLVELRAPEKESGA